MKNENIIKERLEIIKERIFKACQRVNRKENEISILPVSKNFSSEIIKESIDIFNIKRLGENRVQEIKNKYQELSEYNIKWVLIGSLQSNKVKSALNYIDEIQSLDRIELAHSIDALLRKNDKTIKALIQVKTSSEDTKHGVDPNNLFEFIQIISDKYPSIKISGLMTISELTEDRSKVRKCFQLVRKLRDEIAKHDIKSINLENISMGMSNDFEIAIEEGSTEIRIGSAIFGPRLK